jgi:hypothetical protein
MVSTTEPGAADFATLKAQQRRIPNAPFQGSPDIDDPKGSISFQHKRRARIESTFRSCTGMRQRLGMPRPIASDILLKHYAHLLDESADCAKTQRKGSKNSAKGINLAAKRQPTARLGDVSY